MAMLCSNNFRSLISEDPLQFATSIESYVFDIILDKLP